MRSIRIILLAPFLMLTLGAFGSVFGSVRGIVHDAQHRPVENAVVTLRSTTSDWAATSNTDSSGQFIFNPVALGEYTLTVVAPSFNQATANLRVNSGSQPVLHFSLSVATNKETVQVSGAPEAIPTDSATTTTLVGRLDIEHTPGAARSNSLAMITDYVPGAYITHDQLHLRGGHQTSWLIDGVPVPNTNIAS
ncbi:MAG TPA: carboxypeptidase regulatory-like domain-containing protein, partial [Candidatus Polarisedimenticolia bacterium]|nr:carboxypeptidase regulatory-like domain-containing protein [Candidatus Polarisedimenticolia bacterium]